MANWGIATTLKQIVLLLPCRPFFPITPAQICIKEFSEQRLLYIAYSCLEVQTAYGHWITKQPQSLNALKGTLLFKFLSFQDFLQFQWIEQLRPPLKPILLQCSNTLISIEIGWPFTMTNTVLFSQNNY